jgi:hypothetical protein
MIAARINQEHEKENLAAFALHPGVVETDMVSSPSVSPLFISLPYVLIIMTPHCTISTFLPHDKLDQSAGHEFSPDFKIITPQESAQSILKYVDGATRSSAGGKFWSAPDDAEIPW